MLFRCPSLRFWSRIITVKCYVERWTDGSGSVAVSRSDECQ